MSDVELLAFELSDSERGILAARLLDSLPPILRDEDEGMTEALRRDAELDAHPEMAISYEELNRRIAQRRSECA
jgi:hypothetical protein